MLAVNGLNAWYGRSHVIQDISFEVARGEIVTLLGRNGAGKSTTIRSIMGLVEKRAGSVLFEGIGSASQRAWPTFRSSEASCRGSRCLKIFAWALSPRAPKATSARS
jgi:branched-chain amino acid transport system ATP-binding protein